MGRPVLLAVDDEPAARSSTFDGLALRDPSFAEIAEALSAPTRPAEAAYDVTVVGAGPAGLAAAMYGASEGLSRPCWSRRRRAGRPGPPP
jgi:thioredoxin reductase (NADPH)